MANYSYGILVAGNGDTSRANVEALLEDYILARGENGVMVIPFSSTPSAGQIWSAQIASSNKLDVIIVAPPNGILESVPKGQYVQSTSDGLYENSAHMLKEMADAPEMFILWDDEDPSSLEFLAQAKMREIPACDLRNGLVGLTPTENLTPSPAVVIPEAEQLTPVVDTVVEEEVAEDAAEDEEEAEDDEDETVDVIYSAIYAFAEIIADMVAERIKGSK